jgi:hypothetical protein
MSLQDKLAIRLLLIEMDPFIALRYTGLGRFAAE